MTTTTIVSPELQARIVVLRERIENNRDLWASLGELLDIDAAFGAEVGQLTADGSQWEQAQACGYGDVLDLFAIVAEVIRTPIGGAPTPEHVRRLRELHPEWFSAAMVGPQVADALSRV